MVVFHINFFDILVFSLEFLVILFSVILKFLSPFSLIELQFSIAELLPLSIIEVLE